MIHHGVLFEGENYQLGKYCPVQLQINAMGSFAPTHGGIVPKVQCLILKTTFDSVILLCGVGLETTTIRPKLFLNAIYFICQENSPPPSCIPLQANAKMTLDELFLLVNFLDTANLMTCSSSPLNSINHQLPINHQHVFYPPHDVNPLVTAAPPSSTFIAPSLALNSSQSEHLSVLLPMVYRMKCEALMSRIIQQSSD